MRRAAAALAAVALLAGCGGGDEPPAAPQATSTPVDVSIPTPPPSDVKEFAGQNLTEKDTTRFARTVTKALRTGNERPFVALFDPKKPELIDRMRTRFATVGPDFVLVRGVSGILDVKSGLDYYVTKAPSG